MTTDWRDIADAPRDGTAILLAWPKGHVSIGRWDDQRYHKKPRPHFTGHYFGANWERENQPTHWMPLPPAPSRTVLGGE